MKEAHRNSSPRLEDGCIIIGKMKRLIVGLMVIFSFFSKHKNTLAQGLPNTANTCTSSMTTAKLNMSQQLEDRLRGALWAFMAGDALASPTHWYYGGKSQIIHDYGGEIADYTKPNYNLAGSILNKSDLNGGGRSTGKGSSEEQTIIGHVINHGKQDLWSPRKSVHYHATLEKGENTLEVQIARVLMKSIVQNGGNFDANHFRRSYIDFMTTPGSHNDTYASTCHRMFFANLVHRNLPAESCPDNDRHNVDTIDGLILPTIVAMASSCRQKSLSEIGALAAQCAAVTRKSTVLENAAGSWANVVHSALQDENEDDFNAKLDSFSKSTIRRLPNAGVADASTMSACYLSGSLPGMLDMIAKYSKKNNGLLAWDGLLANSNVGGENVHRGSIMGAILGARAKDSNLPQQLKHGLFHHSELSKEIDDFVHSILAGPDDDEKKDEL